MGESYMNILLTGHTGKNEQVIQWKQALVCPQYRLCGIKNKR